ncbi:hypothetical protein DFH09DRAFT_1283051 [Mycena vulgaris]|nr:hypothetical protein DFH09DRAFT_1283051 [Mycena vulgaris]
MEREKTKRKKKRTRHPTPKPAHAVPTPRCIGTRRRDSSPQDAAHATRASAMRGYKPTTQLRHPRCSTRRGDSAHEHEHGLTAAASSAHRRWRGEECGGGARMCREAGWRSPKVYDMKGKNARSPASSAFRPHTTPSSASPAATSPLPPHTPRGPLPKTYPQLMRPRKPCPLRPPLLLARDGGAAHVEHERAENEGWGYARALELGARRSVRRAARARGGREEGVGGTAQGTALVWGRQRRDRRKGVKVARTTSKPDNAGALCPLPRARARRPGSRRTTPPYPPRLSSTRCCSLGNKDHGRKRTRDAGCSARAHSETVGKCTAAVEERTECGTSEKKRNTLGDANARIRRGEADE